MSVFEDWAKAKEHLIRALEHAKGTHTIDDCALLVGCGHFKLWVGEECAMLTEFSTFPQMKVLNVFAAGGKLKGLLKLENDLIKFAKDNGCSRITEMGRKGWEKVLPGVEAVGTALHRDI